MTDASLATVPFNEGDFSVGRVLNRTWSVLSRNLLPFCLVTFIANLPNIAFFAMIRPGVPASTAVWLLVAALVGAVLNTLSQAIVLYGAFEDMRGRPVDLVESTKIGLRRFFAVLGVALCTAILAGLSAILLLFPAFIVATMLFVSLPACVVERLGPIKSMGRSARLTKGHRWKIFGLWLAVMMILFVVQGTLTGVTAGIGAGKIPGLVVRYAWSAVWGAFYAILVVVTYHDLRVAKEGVDTDQIAAVFD